MARIEPPEPRVVLTNGAVNVSSYFEVVVAANPPTTFTYHHLLNFSEVAEDANNDGRVTSSTLNFRRRPSS